MHSASLGRRTRAVSESRCVDVVVDVHAANVDRAYTYLTNGETPALGARVRVPFGGRIVAGWVVSEPAELPNGGEGLKAIASIEDSEAQFGAEAVHLASWLRRRYACTFREALTAVAPRATAGGSRALFAFASAPQPGDRLAGALQRAFKSTPFTTLAAARALARVGQRTPSARLQQELSRLVRAGILSRAAGKETAGVRPTARPQIAVLVDAAVAKGAVQRQLAAALADSGGSLPLPEARRRAGASAAVVRRAQRAGVLRVEEERASPQASVELRSRAFTPTEEQRTAIERIDELARAGGGAALLHGVTGSGKTFVYSRLVDRVRRRGGAAIVMVPEIALTPQTAARFEAIFGSKVGVMHSGLSAGDRARVWQDAAAGSLDVIVGARSAVFAPLSRLALIVVDEEHEPSYKQDVAPRYDAGAVARERMRHAGGAVVFGSATPSLEIYAEAMAGGVLYVPMRTRATAAPMPPVEIVDMTGQRAGGGRHAIGPALLEAMESALGRGEKVLLFVNRRGYAVLLLCRVCGFAPRCKRCAVSLVMHSSDGSLRCHICGDAFRVPATCPKCGAADLAPYGFGTQRVEEEIARLLPDARIVRMDADTTGGRGSHGRLLHSFGNEANVLIGTQMVAKGLDFPTVTVVGVVSADLDLNRPDFRAAERTFQLLTQVAGRAGRAAPGSRVVVQTYSPQHYAIQFAAQARLRRLCEQGARAATRAALPAVRAVGVCGDRRRGPRGGCDRGAEARGLAARTRGRCRDAGPGARPAAEGSRRIPVAARAQSTERGGAACGVRARASAAQER